jgi:hypothetical protein
MLAGEFSSRWIWYKIPYMCIIARASTNRMILFAFRFDCSRRLRYDIGQTKQPVIEKLSEKVYRKLAFLLQKFPTGNLHNRRNFD